MPREDGKPRILISGASSGIGRVLATQLIDEGFFVRGVGRVPGRLPAGASKWVADLATGDGVSPAMFDEIDFVYHCAGEVARRELMRPLHVQGTRRLLEAAENNAGRDLRWVQLSSVGAYGPPDAVNRVRTVDEQSAERPHGEYEVTKTESDDLVRAAGARGALSFVIVRPTAVIGRTLPCRSLRRLIELVRRGWYVHVGEPTALANYVHVDDVVSALRLCGHTPKATGEVFNVASDCSWAALIARIADLANVPTPRLRLPASPLRAMAQVLAAMRGPQLAHHINVLSGHTAYPTTKIANRLGFALQHPLPDAIRDVMGAPANV